MSNFPARLTKTIKENYQDEIRVFEKTGSLTRGLFMIMQVHLFRLEGAPIETKLIPPTESGKFKMCLEYFKQAHTSGLFK